MPWGLHHILTITPPASSSPSHRLTETNLFSPPLVHKQRQKQRRVSTPFYLLLALRSKQGERRPHKCLSKTHFRPSSGPSQEGLIQFGCTHRVQAQWSKVSKAQSKGSLTISIGESSFCNISHSPLDLKLISSYTIVEGRSTHQVSQIFLIALKKWWFIRRRQKWSPPQTMRIWGELLQTRDSRIWWKIKTGWIHELVSALKILLQTSQWWMVIKLPNWQLDFEISLQYGGSCCKRRERINILTLVETWVETKNLLKQKFLLINYSKDPRSSF